MQEVDLLAIFVAPLNRLGCRYMLTGSVAATLYGEPRLTHDVDVVIEFTPDTVEQLIGAFPSVSFSVPPAEVLQIECRRSVRGHCNIIHFETGLKADLYFLGRDPLHLWAIEKRRSFSIGDEQIWVAPPEYVILKKLLFYKEGGSEKHLRDINLMLEHSGDLISLGEVESRVITLGVEKEWQAAREIRL